MEATFEDRHKLLLTTLTELANLLAGCGEDRWAAWATRNRDLIARGQATGLDGVRAAYGGTGSLNDLILHPDNGHSLPLSNVQDVNERLERLRSLAWSLATEMRRELDRDPPRPHQPR